MSAKTIRIGSYAGEPKQMRLIDLPLPGEDPRPPCSKCRAPADVRWEHPAVQYRYLCAPCALMLMDRGVMSPHLASDLLEEAGP